MEILKLLEIELHQQADDEKAEQLQKFFKTGEGEYGEGDVFLGITVPDQRKIAKKFWKETGPEEIKELLNTKIHEKRLIALLMLIEKFGIADNEKKKRILDFYLRNLSGVNNWDLVDLSAPKIVGDYLIDNQGEKNILYLLANSDDLWKKRVAVISCLSFIKEKDFEDILKISEILLKDGHDLIQKGVGWMLREVGKKDEKVLKDFLKKNYKDMPRTMLRYAIEHFNEKERKKYLKGDA